MTLRTICNLRLTYGKAGLLRKTAMAILFAALAAQQPQAETVSVTALGDSLVHGFGLPIDDGFVPQLGRWLEARGIDAAVANAGVSGDTTAGGLARIAWTLDSEPDALIVVLGGNDLLRGVPPATSRKNLDGILSAAGTAGVPVLLVGQEVPENYGPDYKAELEAAFSELAEEHGAMFYPRYFAALEPLGTRRKVRERYFQADGLHPNADGVAIIVEDIGPLVVELIGRAEGR